MTLWAEATIVMVMMVEKATGAEVAKAIKTMVVINDNSIG
jgi:hypothetical protein